MEPHRDHRQSTDRGHRQPDNRAHRVGHRNQDSGLGMPGMAGFEFAVLWRISGKLAIRKLGTPKKDVVAAMALAFRSRVTARPVKGTACRNPTPNLPILNRASESWLGPDRCRARPRPRSS